MFEYESVRFSNRFPIVVRPTDIDKSTYMKRSKRVLFRDIFFRTAHAFVIVIFLSARNYFGYCVKWKNEEREISNKIYVKELYLYGN